MRLLVFDTWITGHRLEYFHHIYMGLYSKGIEAVLVMPEAFIKIKDDYEWPDTPKIQIDLIPQELAEWANKGNILTMSYRHICVLKKYIKKHSVDQVFLITLIEYIPFLFLLLFYKTKISGIIYNITLYNWKSYSWMRKIGEVYKYFLLSKLSLLSNVYILNDNASACYLNRKWNTNHFRYLPDPFNEIGYSAKNIRGEFGIDEGCIVFLHFGGLQSRKGTLEIVDAIRLVPDKYQSQFVFIFAGSVYADIKDEFYNKIHAIEDNMKVLVFDTFCENRFLSDLCFSSDYILMPYKNTAASSGVLAYASKYGKPVIAPNTGLIGKLVRKNNLGFLIPSPSSTHLNELFCELGEKPVVRTNSSYMKLMNVRNFIDTIVGFLNE